MMCILLASFPLFWLVLLCVRLDRAEYYVVGEGDAARYYTASCERVWKSFLARDVRNPEGPQVA